MPRLINPAAAGGHNDVVASYSVNPQAVAYARQLIDARQYVLDSDWGKVQPRPICAPLKTIAPVAMNTSSPTVRCRSQRAGGRCVAPQRRPSRRTATMRWLCASIVWSLPGDQPQPVSGRAAPGHD